MADLQRLIDDALQTLADRPDGHLPLPLRRRIQAQFGPAPGVLNGGPTEGLRACVDLAWRAAKRVEHHWNEGTADDDRFAQVLALAPGLIQGRVEPETAGQALGDFELVTMELDTPGGPVRASAAARAAAAVVSLALAGTYSDAVPEGYDDDDLDPYSWEAAYCASLAETSVPSEPDYDPEAGRRFWIWYLTEAVPAAGAGGGLGFSG